MISQHQQQQQTLKILPQQIQLLNLFQLNSLELQMHLRQEMDQNPYLEETTDMNDRVTDQYDHQGEHDYKDWEEYGYNDLPDYKREYANYFGENNLPDRPIVSVIDFRDEAKKQLCLRDLDDRTIAIANYLIDSLEDSGLLSKDLEAIADDFSFGSFMTTPEEVGFALGHIQSLDPAGFGARDIRECWLLQLARMNPKRPDVKKSIALLRDHYDDFKARRFDRIMQELDLEEEEFRMIVQFLSKLPMRPISEQLSSISPKDNIVPDIQISLDNDIFNITVCGISSENFRVSDSLQETMKATKDKGALQFLRSKLQSANWLLYALRQRNESMMKITKAIVQFQKEFFIDGDINKLNPMILKNIADQVGLDISTVSRLTSNKYADTHFGTIHLKDLFTEGIINKAGEVISNKVIQHALEEVIEQEDKKNPYTDQQLVTILMNKGYKVARRTVAKYRDLLQIPVAQVRAMWA
ncbi:RNA polymerase factor sigma-54 [Flavihumibacter petaseus]|uniref:RNA polymerase sigma-54 factor n=1 Tax=Flavihumibacter petaseus NBRC 106054 TaxID=1220578 RepID=A0A0E9MZ99_9BACT|nr:RNA polymerase factor sigma-54 [Flavihumibacter petaseus]GAO42420.1 RNA polymerase sigma-54 factor [Flavihumibacter petaseus NBRC 106054]